MRPNSLDEIIGQNKIKQTLRVMIKSAKKRNTAIGHILIASPSGRGKTSIARVIAKEMSTDKQNAKMHYAHAKTLKNPADLIPFFSTKVKTGDILFIDEIHSISSDMAEWLYLIMEDFLLIKTDGSKIDLNRFTIIGATTHIGMLPKPFKDRFKYIAELEDYTEEDLLEIAKRAAAAEEINLSGDALDILAKTARYTPRLVINRVEFIRDYMIASDITTVESEHILEVLDMQGVDSNGLTEMDRKYLKALSGGNPVSLKQLAAKVEVNEITIQNEIEPFLLKKDMVEITNKGRQLKLAQSSMDEDELM